MIWDVLRKKYILIKIQLKEQLIGQIALLNDFKETRMN